MSHCLTVCLCTVIFTDCKNKESKALLILVLRGNLNVTDPFRCRAGMSGSSEEQQTYNALLKIKGFHRDAIKEPFLNLTLKQKWEEHLKNLKNFILFIYVFFNIKKLQIPWVLKVIHGTIIRKYNLREFVRKCQDLPFKIQRTEHFFFQKTWLLTN